MKIEIEIPDGQFCDGCKMLIHEYEAGLWFCKLLEDGNSFIADSDGEEKNLVKSKDCPALKK